MLEKHIHRSLESNTAKKNALEKIVQECQSDLKKNAYETITHLPYEKLNTLVVNKSNRDKKSYFDSILFQTRCVKKGWIHNQNGTPFAIDGLWGKETEIKLLQLQQEKNTNTNNNNNTKHEIVPPAPIKFIKQKEVKSMHAQGPLSYEEYKEASDKQREKACFESLLQLGFSPVIAAAIAGNIYVESYDRRKTKKRFHTTSYGDGGKSFGLCQRNNNGRNKASGRLATLKQFAQSQGTPPDAYDTQLAFIKYELENTEQNAGKQLAGINDVAQAAKIFMTQYERPRNRSSLKERQRKAKEILQEYGGVA